MSRLQFFVLGLVAQVQVVALMSLWKTTLDPWVGFAQFVALLASIGFIWLRASCCLTNRWVPLLYAVAASFHTVIWGIIFIRLLLATRKERHGN